MQYTTFGRTGLRVSVAGLGCGGFSRVGLGTGKTEDEAVAIIRAALDLGVNLIDTAAVYGTEGVVGRAIAGRDRAQVVLATKAAFGRGPDIAAPETVVASLDNSLRVLGTDYVDIFQLHAVAPDNYARVRDELVPALLRERDKGKFRFLGITETPPFDHDHAMLRQALPDGLWDSVMVAQHMLHQGARDTVYPLSQAHGAGTLLMFVVRGIFAQPERLAATLRELALPELDFLVHPDGASTMVDAAYRFIRHEPGVDVVLFGTGDIGHLQTNIASLLKPPLPATDIERLRRVYGHVAGIGLDVPGRGARRT
jgi:aryl-alcohol dehydrogenase-like predicted oxidoreductase